ncbi:MAG TPA: hypothetical protein VFL85_00150 [Candidatus Saccharimonadales bacterium]|nr:hypothetical protein [Candidatus Saccharimonadales bacterium]
MADDDNDDANLADAANQPPTGPGSDAGSAYGSNADDAPANPPGPMANFDASQTVDGGVNENPANWGANTDMQIGASTGKTSMGEEIVDDNYHPTAGNTPDTPTIPGTGNPDATQSGGGA